MAIKGPARQVLCNFAAQLGLDLAGALQGAEQLLASKLRPIHLHLQPRLCPHHIHEHCLRDKVELAKADMQT